MAGNEKFFSDDEFEFIKDRYNIKSDKPTKVEIVLEAGQPVVIKVTSFAESKIERV